jgi:hypothetical protein
VGFKVRPPDPIGFMESIYQGMMVAGPELSVHCRSSSTSAAEALYKFSSGCRLQ